MTLPATDFAHIRGSLLAILVALGAGGAAVVLSDDFAGRAQREQQNAQRRLDTARKQLAGAEEDRANMQAYTLGYGALLTRNVIGDGQRLDWIESLEKIREQHRVLDFKYTIGPQRPYTLPATLDSGNFTVSRSDMALQLDLLHEGQLLDFFEVLHTGASGWFSLDHCVLERGSDANTETRIKAACTGGWLTMKHRNDK